MASSGLEKSTSRMSWALRSTAARFLSSQKWELEPVKVATFFPFRSANVAKGEDAGTIISDNNVQDIHAIFKFIPALRPTIAGVAEVRIRSMRSLAKDSM